MTLSRRKTLYIAVAVLTMRKQMKRDGVETIHPVSFRRVEGSIHLMRIIFLVIETLPALSR